MVQERRRLLMLLLVAMLTPALVVTAKSAWEADACPPFERKHYEYNGTTRIEGDLYAVEHVRGFVVFKQCFQGRDHVLAHEVRYEAWGGAYEVRVEGSTFEDRHLLVGDDNSTGWYDARRVREFRYAGVSGGAEPGTNAVPESWKLELALARVE